MNIDGANNAIELCNIALGNVGCKPIESFDQKHSKAARTAKRVYPLVRTNLITEFPWNFSNDYKKIPAEAVPKFHPRFKNSYRIPNNCLHVRSVDCHNEYEWEIVGRFICTNTEDEIIIEYTIDDADITNCDPRYRMLLIYYLSKQFSSLPGSRQMAAQFEQEAQALILRVKRTDQNTGNRRKNTKPLSAWQIAASGGR